MADNVDPKETLLDAVKRGIKEQQGAAGNIFKDGQAEGRTKYTL